MNVAIMQPYFFPYIGYFSLIQSCDKFIIFDTPQFMRKGWIERNRILKLSGGSTYIKVPLIKSPLDTAILDMKINNDTDWKNKIISQLDIYKKIAPFYKPTMDLVNQCLDGEYTKISKLNENIIRKISLYLGITTEISVYSSSTDIINHVNNPDEWALEICKKIGAKTYINAPGGKEFFNKEKYEKENIELLFINPILEEYKQGRNSFEPGLSIIDLLMFNSKETVFNLINNYTLTKN
ncbi:TPA: WbqC family protein [Morganella morganii]|uniref:WbqC family protein n=1 Tax=Morganella morganii TaxID=582 RepID=UPI001BDAC964|nr:WbqC family protein [Morganella morganii]MBT0389325.1 WbqC family protein [Morganella morganii subsp. morganii]HCT4930422.1 WbqC family protein [Morganella morganii]HEJ1051803.1 WbqC family protein [Morganella morganii]